MKPQYLKKNINTFSPFSGCFLPQLFEQQLYQLVNYIYFIMYYRTQKCKGKETRKNAFLDLRVQYWSDYFLLRLFKDVVVIFCAQLWFCLNSCSHLQELNVEPASVAARYEESVPGDPARLTRPIIQLHRPPRLHWQVPQTGAKQLRLLGER